MDTHEERPPLLLLEDDPLAVRVTGRVLRPFVDLVIATTAMEGLRVLLGDQPLIGAIVDVRLPDGNGVDVVAMARSHRPILPVLFLTAHATPEIVNLAFRLSATFLCKPCESEDVIGFVRRIADKSVADRDRMLLDVFSVRHRLSPRQTEAVSRALADPTYTSLAERMEVSVETVRAHVDGILEKTGLSTLEDVVAEVRRLVGNA